MSIISIQRDQNNTISLVRMQVSDSLGDVNGTDYILNNQNEINILNNGTWAWFITDMILVAANDGNGFFEFIDDTFATVVMFGEKADGVINPGLQNNLPYYAANGNVLSPLSNMANAVLATNGSSVPALTQTLPTAVQTNITQLGTVGTGTWHATPITVPYGGTGNTTFTAYSLICAGTTATGTFQNVSGLGTSGYVLTSNGAGALPTWQANAASGTINTGNQNDLPYYSASPSGTTLSAIAGADSSVLITSGMGVPSLSQTLPSAVQGNITAVGTISSGTWNGSVIGAAYGGTGVSNPTAHGILIGEGASAVTPIVLSAGQILIGTTASDPTAAAINSGTSVLVQNSTGSITVGLAPIASNDILSNITAGSAAPIANTLTATIDAAIGSTQGDILYRSATAWSVLVPSTSGYVLTTGGVAANPSWTAVSASGAITTIDGDSGTATPSSGVVTISGGSTGLTTSGSSHTLNLTGTLGVANGGTNNTTFTAYSVICAGTTATGAFQNVSGVGTSGQVLSSNGAGMLPGWVTIPGATSAALTSSNDTNVTLTLGGAPTTALLTAASITAGWSGQLSLARGGTAANLTASNGGIFYSTASAGAILSGTTTAGQLLTSGASTTPAWTTSTYPATNAVNTLLYASSANTMAALATANSGVLVTSAGGVPSISSTLPSFTTNTITFSPTTAGIVGTTTNDNTAAGNVGEFKSSTVLSGAAVALSNGGSADITSLSLTAGDWDVWGNVCLVGVGTNQQGLQGWLSTTSATYPAASLVSGFLMASAVLIVTGSAVTVLQQRFSLSGTTTIYLSAYSASTAGSPTGCGNLFARRRR